MSSEFTQALATHLACIRAKDLDGFTATLTDGDELTLVMPGGNIKKTRAEFLEFHKNWFADPDWSMSHEVIVTQESNGHAFAVVKSDYKDVDGKGQPVQMQLMLGLGFKRDDSGRWLLVHDQNTEVKG